MGPEHRGWYSRGYLPHFDSSEVIQTVNFRLNDSLPETALLRLIEAIEDETESEKHEALENYLDSGYGRCWLKDPGIAKIVEDALLYFDGERYRLLAWVIMPNHVHVMISIIENFRLSDIVKSWKSFTSRQANHILNRQGAFWQWDYFDRFIRNETHFYSAKDYIHENPVKAGLVDKPEGWPFSSANPKNYSRNASL